NQAITQIYVQALMSVFRQVFNTRRYSIMPLRDLDVTVLINFCASGKAVHHISTMRRLKQCV
ncbi:TPA: hypothetical protein ACHJPB_005188, partial [Escherichia coli]